MKHSHKKLANCIVVWNVTFSPSVEYPLPNPAVQFTVFQLVKKLSSSRGLLGCDAVKWLTSYLNPSLWKPQIYGSEGAQKLSIEPYQPAGSITKYFSTLTLILLSKTTSLFIRRSWTKFILLPFTHSSDRPFNGYQGFLPWGVKRPRPEADHPPPSSAEVRNAWSYTSTLSIRLHGLVLG
jgi:hypothetical protein